LKLGPPGFPLQTGSVFAVSNPQLDTAWVLGSGSSSVTGLWNGERWRTFPEISHLALSDLDATSGSDAWVVGSSDVFPVAWHWNGATWDSTSVPSPPGAQYAIFKGVSVLSPTDVWAAGEWADAAGVHPLI